MKARASSHVLDVQAARLAAADLLSRRAWTERELATRLRRRGAPLEVAAEVVGDLMARGYLDDAAFARQWIETRSARGYGATRLRSELRARGVAPPLIEHALTVLIADRSLETARTVALRRLSVLKRGDPERVAHRLGDYLRRRGYSASVVRRVVRDLTGASAAIALEH